MTTKTNHKVITKFLTFTLSLALAFVDYGGLAFAADFNVPDGSYVISNSTKKIAPGIEESEIITNNKSGSNQNIDYVCEVDLKNTKTTKIISSYGDYDASSWKMQKLTDQAKAVEKKTGQNVVAGINADFFNMSTGEPVGALVMQGKVYHKANGRPYFAILKDGSAAIRNGDESLDDVESAVGGDVITVKDGKLVNLNDGIYQTQVYSRTAIGIKEDGSVVTLATHGRLYPVSIGHTYKEVAEMMIGLGCKTVISLDGGGSSTYSSQYEGSDDFEVRNSPSDGTERKISSGLLIISTAKATGEFEHASISPSDTVYTPNSSVKFEAKGVDSSGGKAPLPSNAKWQLDSKSKELGSIDSNGEFISNGKTGDVKVNLVSGGNVVGSSTITVANPDSISFSSEEVSLGFEKTSDLGLVVKYKGRDVVYKDGDFKWTMSDNSMGSFKGNMFTSSDSATVEGDITATSVNDSNVKGSVHAIIGRLPSVVMDFEDKVDENGNIIKAKDYYTFAKGTVDPSGGNITSQVGDGLLLTANYDRGCEHSGEIVNLDSSPVRFGSNSLKLNYDFSNVGNITEGACVGFTEATKQVEGTPTGIGMWVYAPEGTPNLWLRIRVKNGNGNVVTLNFTEAGKDNGINWTGWKYVEASLEGQTGPFSLIGGETIRLMYVPPTQNGFYTKESGSSELVEVPKAECKGSIYIDNLQFVYGANNDDIDNPNVDSITANDEEITDKKTINTNTISFKSLFSDVQNKYTSGIDYDTVRMYLDGKNVTDNSNCVLLKGDNAINLYDAKLANGPHSIKILVRDKFGNETTETRYFIVKGEEKYITVNLSPTTDKNPILNKTFDLALTTDNIDDIKSINTNVKINKKFSDFEVKFNDDYTGNSSYDSKSGIIKIDAIRNEDATSTKEGTIATISFKIPKELTKGTNFTYVAQNGEITYNSEKEDGFTSSFATLQNSLQVDAPLVVKPETMIVGSSGKIYVYDIDGKVVEGSEVFKDDGTSLGTTNSQGYIETDALCKSVEKYTIYAQKGEDISYSVTGQSMTSAGNEDGLPEYVISNATNNATNSKNITWMSNPQKSDAKAVIQIAKKSDYTTNGEKSFKNVVGTSTLQNFSGSTDLTKNYSVRVNKVLATGLSSNTQYVYRVGDGKAWSDVKEFKTVRSGTNTNFFVIGDTQSTEATGGNANLNQIQNQLSKGSYSFGIQTGDAIENASLYDDWKGVLNTFGSDYLSKVDMIHVLGNHEFMGDLTGDAAKNIYNLSNDRHYSVEYGNTYVAVINYSTNKDELTKDLEWLKQDAKNSKCKWKVLTMHQPAYYTNTTGANEIINELVPSAAEEAGIDFVFSGHDHSYARTEPLKEGKVDENNGIVYYICGSTGEKSYSITNNPDFHFAKTTQDFNGMYLTASTTEDKFTVVAHDLDGSVIDSYTKTKVTESCKDGHDYVYEDGYLTCKNCGYDKEIGNYTGFVTDKKTGKKMYFIEGKAKTGWFTYGESEVYHFNNKGLADELEVIKDTKTNCTERGQKIYKCKATGETYTVNDVKPPGHDFQPVKQADGSIKYICCHKEYNCTAEGKYIGDKKIKLNYTKTTYNGNRKSPGVTIEGLTKGEDYTVSYWDNINAGTAKVRIKAKGNTYAGIAYVEYTIRPQDMSSKEATLSFSKVNCNGEEQKPEVKIEGLEANKDFTVKYSNNIDPGTATVTITGKGNYTGTITKQFKILGNDVSQVTGLTSTERTSTGFKLKWDKVDNADGYNVYEYNSNDKSYNLIGAVEGNDKTNYVVNSLKEGTVYKYAVRAYKKVGSKNYVGAYSSILTTTTYPAQVTGVTISNRTTSGFKLKWDKVENCDGYKVYKYNESNKTYTYLKTIEGNSNTSYTITNLTSGTTYKYAIRAYKKLKSTYNGQYSDVLTTTTSPSKVTGLKTKDRTSTSITLGWNKVSNAEGYRVYRYNAQKGAYDLIGEVEGNENTTYVDKDATSGKNYYYKVKSYKKINPYVYLSSYSDKLKTCRRLEKPEIELSTPSSGAIKVSWNKISYASGYKVYRSTTKDGTYRSIKTVENGDTTSYTSRGLTRNKTYYYKVRAYKVVDNVKIYGDLSEIKNIETK